MRRRRLLLAPLLLAPLAVVPFRPARAHSFKLGAIEIGHPWAKPSVTSEAAIFMALANLGPRPDRLLGGATPIADEVLIREQDGSPLEYLELLPKRPITLRPGRRYLALHGLKQPLAIDDGFRLTLAFALAGTVTVTAMVEEGPEEEG